MKNLENINICFCFDKNQWMQAGVTITSLLKSAHGKCHYNIYCIISDNVIESFQNDLKNIVNDIDAQSTITFKKVSDNYDNLYASKHLSTAAYFRLQIHKLLPDLERIIYCDVDIIFQTDLLELYNTDIGDNLLGAVLDTDLLNKNKFRHWCIRNNKNKTLFDLKQLYGHCINSGVLIMNLHQIRKENIEQKKWSNLLTKKFYLHDQDILNISCYKRIKYLDPKFNLLVRTINSKLKTNDINYKNKITAAVNNPTIIHYTSKVKPWLHVPVKYFDLWWYFASKTPFYNILYSNYYTINGQSPHFTNCILKKKYYLLGIIPIVLTKHYKQKGSKLYLGKLPLLKIKTK